MNRAAWSRSRRSRSRRHKIYSEPEPEPTSKVARLRIPAGDVSVSQLGCDYTCTQIGYWNLPHMCRVTVPDPENGWTDCAQIWYTIRDLLVGCCAQVCGRYPITISHVQGPLSRSLCWLPQKALYWLFL